MGNRALRQELSNLLKQNKLGRLYSAKKLAVYKRLKAYELRDMISFLKNVRPGLIVNEWGINQVVKFPPKLCVFNLKNGWFVYKIDQIEYESGYLSCGCGEYACFVSESLKTKEQIIASMRESLNDKEWGPSYLAEKYFPLLEDGIDLLTPDGFLVSNWKELVDSNESEEIK